MSRVPVRTVRTPVPGPPADPTVVYERLAARYGTDGVYLLESLAGPEDDCRTTLLGFGPVLGIGIRAGAVEIDGDPVLAERLRAALVADGHVGTDLELSSSEAVWSVLRSAQGLFDAEGSAEEFGFGFLTFVGYDAVRYIEQIDRRIPPGPSLADVTLVLHTGLLRTDVRTGGTELLTHHSRCWESPDPEEVLGLLTATARRAEPDPGQDVDAVHDEMVPGQYAELADRCLEHIAAGDIYQVQVGHEVSIETDAEPVDVYRRLRHRNPSPYMYLAPVDGRVAVGASPEMFVRIRGDRVTMRPIAGTAPYRAQQGEQAVADIGRRLAGDPKEIAEHVMLVDLCRNDIGRICRTGTLDVPVMMAVERYSHVLHLVSTVEGTVDDGRDPWDVVAATFPAGTMTGAPKLRAMEIIESVESSRRGVYAGAIGVVDVGGHTNLALCIRTLVHDEDGYHTRASAGIVADSRPEAEWRETIAKIGATYWAATGEELQP